jgi:glycosyltransferase involved in cell wall biosynthesis
LKGFFFQAKTALPAEPGRLPASSAECAGGTGVPGEPWAGSRRQQFVDVVLYCEKGVVSKGKLLEKHAASLGYLNHLPESFAPIAVRCAAFEDVFVNDTVRFVVRRGSNRFIAVPLTLFAGINSMAPQFVLLHSFNYAWQLLWLKRSLPANTKVLVQNHAEQPFPGLKFQLQRWAARYVDAFLFVSAEQAAPWRARGIIDSRHKVFEVMEGSNTFEFKQQTECRQHLKLPAGPIFLWVGRLDANKDPLTILQGFHRFKQLGHAFSLYMVFNADTLAEEVRQFIGEHRLEEEVHLVGAVPHAELECWCNAADFFVLGSHHEGSGFALCEAMACGCIPVVTNIPSFMAMTNQGTLGLLFEPGNIGQLVQALTHTLGVKLAVARKEARQFFQQELSHEAIAGKIQSACQQLLQ